MKMQGLILCVGLAACGVGGDEQDRQTVDLSALSGSCAAADSVCESSAMVPGGNCHCDAACISFGDCCSDYIAECAIQRQACTLIDGCDGAMYCAVDQTVSNPTIGLAGECQPITNLRALAQAQVVAQYGAELTVPEATSSVRVFSMMDRSVNPGQHGATSAFQATDINLAGGKMARVLIDSNVEGQLRQPAKVLQLVQPSDMPANQVLFESDALQRKFGIAVEPNLFVVGFATAEEKPAFLRSLAEQPMPHVLVDQEPGGQSKFAFIKIAPFFVVEAKNEILERFPTVKIEYSVVGIIIDGVYRELFVGSIGNSANAPTAFPFMKKLELGGVALNAGTGVAQFHGAFGRFPVSWFGQGATQVVLQSAPYVPGCSPIYPGDWQPLAINSTSPEMEFSVRFDNAQNRCLRVAYDGLNFHNTSRRLEVLLAPTARLLDQQGRELGDGSGLVLSDSGPTTLAVQSDTASRVDVTAKWLFFDGHETDVAPFCWASEGLAASTGASCEFPAIPADAGALQITLRATDAEGDAADQTLQVELL